MLFSAHLGGFIDSATSLSLARPVQKLVTALGSMTPGKDAAVKDALTHLKNNALTPTDTNALMDAVRMVRIKNFIATADLGR